MSHLPHIEVMVLGLNAKKDVLSCLDSVQDIDYANYSVTYLDNDSEDGTPEAVASKYPSVNIVEYDDNIGFAAAYDRAIENTDSEYVALLNPDTIVPEDWLSRYADAVAESEDDVAAWAGRINILDSDRVHFTGAKITPMGSGIEPDIWKPKSEVTDEDRKWTATGCGANMLVHRDRFVEIGGFDEDFFLYLEDVDFGWRAWLQGYRVRYVPDAEIEHQFGGVVGSQSPFDSSFRAYHGTKNRKLTLLKNATPKRLIFGLVISLAYDAVLLTQALVAREFGILRTLLKANIDALRALPATIGKRKEIQSDRERSESELKEHDIFINLRESIQFFFYLRNAV